MAVATNHAGVRSLLTHAATARRDDLLAWAYDLAFFIHNDQRIALDLTIRALGRLPATIAAQDKRLYYGGARGTKIWFEDRHLLQQLVYSASLPAERAAETDRPLRPDELIVRFLKHLVWITMRRNVFYVTLAVARLLYGYSTRQTADLYTALVVDPHDIKADAYYRSRKRIVIEELRHRLPSLETTRGTRGETSIAGGPPDDFQRTLAERCLTRFAPWGTTCDEAFAAIGSERAACDLRLVHILLHPPCFQRQTTALGLPDPVSRLQLPHLRHQPSSIALPEQEEDVVLV